MRQSLLRSVLRATAFRNHNVRVIAANHGWPLSPAVRSQPLVQLHTSATILRNRDTEANVDEPIALIDQLIAQHSSDSPRPAESDDYKHVVDALPALRDEKDSLARQLSMAVVDQDWYTVRRAGALLAAQPKHSNVESLTLNEVLRRLGRSVREKHSDLKAIAESAVAIYEQLRASGHSLAYIRYIGYIQALGQLQRTSEARAIFQQMQQQGVPADTRAFNVILAAHRGGDTTELREALSLFGEMRRRSSNPNGAGSACTPDRITYNTMIALAVKAGELELAEELRGDMARTRVKPDLFTFSPLIHVYTTHDKANAVQRTLLAMRNANLQPDTILCNMMLGMYGRLGRLADMEAVYRQYILSTDPKRVRPDSKTFVAMLKAFGSHDRLDLAIKYFNEEMPRHGIRRDAYLYSAMMEAYLRKGLDKEVEKLAAAMKTRGVRLNEFSYSLLIRMRGMQKNPEAAQRLFDQLIAERLRPDARTYAALIEAHATHGNLEKAMQLFEIMQAGSVAVPRKSKLSVDASAHLVLIQALLERGDLTAAHAIYQNLREFDYQLDARYYNQLLGLFMPVDPEYGQRVLDDMRRDQVPCNHYTYATLLSAYGARRDLHSVVQVHRLMVVDSSFDPDVAVWNALMDAYQRCDQPHHVVQIWRQLTYGATKLDEADEHEVDTVIWKGVDDKADETGEGEAAEPAQTLDEHRPLCMVDNATISIMLDTCGWHHYPWLAKRVWYQMPQLGLRPNFNNYASYVECLARIGDFDESLRVLTDASIKTDSPLPWPTPKAVRTVTGLLRHAERDEQLDMLTRWITKHRPDLLEQVTSSDDDPSV